MSKLPAIRLTTMTTVTIKPICMWEQLIMFSKAPKMPVIRPEIQTNWECWRWRAGGKCRSGRRRLKASSLWYSWGVWITVKTTYELGSLRKMQSVVHVWETSIADCLHSSQSSGAEIQWSLALYFLSTISTKREHLCYLTLSSVAKYEVLSFIVGVAF